METTDELMKILNTPEEVNYSQKPFVELLEYVSSNSQDKYSIKLTQEIINLLNIILKSNPEYFNSFDKIFSSIIIDDKINTNDIPELILLLQKLYEILFDLNVKDIKKGLSINTCKLIIKFIIDVIITEKISNTEKRKELLDIISILIDAGCELITFRQKLKNKSNIFSCFLNLFMTNESKGTPSEEKSSENESKGTPSEEKSSENESNGIPIGRLSPVESSPQELPLEISPPQKLPLEISPPQELPFQESTLLESTLQESSPQELPLEISPPQELPLEISPP